MFMGYMCLTSNGSGFRSALPELRRVLISFGSWPFEPRSRSMHCRRAQSFSCGVVNDPENFRRSVHESLTFFIHVIHRGGLGYAISIGHERFSEIKLRSPAAEEGHERPVGF